MSTSYKEDIFPLFLNKITGYNDALLSIAERNEIYSNYIKSASSKFTECNTDISTSYRVDATGVTETFDGGTSIYVMTSTSLTGSDFVVLVDGATSVSGTEFTVTGRTFTFATGYYPATGSDNVSISWEFAGEFTNNLTQLEIEILSNMMVLEWVKPYVLNSDYLEEKMASKDFQQFSKANMLGELRRLKKDIELDIDSLVIKYGYSGDLTDLA